MTDGRLLARIRAAKNAAAWEPPYVANQLAGTHQAADRARQTAALRTAEAQAATDLDRRRELEWQAWHAAAEAERLDKLAAKLHEVDQGRAQAREHNAATHELGARSAAEYARRHADDPYPTVEWTGEEWLAEQRAGQAVEERDQPITEADIHDADTWNDDHHADQDLDQEQDQKQDQERDQEQEQPADERPAAEDRQLADQHAGPTGDAPAVETAGANEDIAAVLARLAEFEAKFDDQVRTSNAAEVDLAVSAARAAVLKIQAQQQAAREAAEYADYVRSSYHHDQDQGYDDSYGYDRYEDGR
jgi:hypothetical protein